MFVELTTVYDKKRILAFNDYIARSKKGFWIFMGVCTFIVLGAVGFVAALGDLDMTMIMLLGLVLLVDALEVFIYVVFPRVTLKKNKNVGTNIKYTFREDNFEIVAENPNMHETATIKYSIIKKIRRNGNDVYLFISNFQCYIVDVSELSPLQVGEFKALIAQNIDSKKIKW